MVKTDVGHRANAYVGQPLPERKTAQPAPLENARPGGPRLKEKEVVVPKHGTGEPRIAALGGIRIQVVLEEVHIGKGHGASKRSGDAAGCGPVGLSRNLAKLPTQAGSSCIGRIDQEEELLILPVPNHAGRWSRDLRERRGVLDSDTVDYTQRRHSGLDGDLSENSRDGSLCSR
jgi:hypothetical protein